MYIYCTHIAHISSQLHSTLMSFSESFISSYLQWTDTKEYRKCDDIRFSHAILLFYLPQHNTVQVKIREIYCTKGCWKIIVLTLMVVIRLCLNISIDKYKHFPSNITIQLYSNTTTCFGPLQNQESSVERYFFSCPVLMYADLHIIFYFLWNVHYESDIWSWRHAMYRAKY